MAEAVAFDIRYVNGARWFAEVLSLAQAFAPEAVGRAEARPDSSADFEDVRRSRDGDGEAYRRLVERHQGQVAAIMWRFSRDPETHEELVQNVFVEAYLSLSTFRAQAPFEHWLARIATRAGYRFWKEQARERAHPTVPLEEWDGLPADPPDDLAPSKAAALLHRLLEQLPPRDRLVLTLQYLQDRSVAETAQLTGWSPAMVKVQSWRARRKLRKLFERARPEEHP